MALSPMELALWREHFERFPPGADVGSHQLLADIYCLLFAVFSDPKKAPRLGRIDVAPWLFPPKQARARAEAREEHRRHVEGTFMRRGYNAALAKLGIRLRGEARDG